MSPVLNIIIVNYRTPGLTVDCLASLEPEMASVAGTRVWVVDNASGDDSDRIIREAIAARGWGAWATLLPATKNYGFAGGNNRGLEAAGFAPYTLLLNSDTIVHRGCLQTCLDIMGRDPGIGVMSCKLLNADGTVQNVARRFPHPFRIAAVTLGLDSRFPRQFGWADVDDPHWDRATMRRDVDWLGGAFLFIRGDVMARIGPLDESFFFYGEDIEFCHRVWKAGFRCRYDPAASVTHLGGGSSDPARLAASARSVHAWSARYRVQRLCYGRLAAALVRAIDVAGMTVRLAWAKVRGRASEPQARDWAASLRVITHRLGAIP